jgi:hypothetical protein
MSNRSFHTARGSNNNNDSDNNGSELGNENVENLQAYVDPSNAQIRYMQHVENEYNRLRGIIRHMNKELDRLYAEAMRLKGIRPKTEELRQQYIRVATRYNELLEALPGIEAQRNAAKRQFVSVQKLGGGRRTKNRKNKYNAKTTTLKYRRRA